VVRIGAQHPGSLAHRTEHAEDAMSARQFDVVFTSRGEGGGATATGLVTWPEDDRQYNRLRRCRNMRLVVVIFFAFVTRKRREPRSKACKSSKNSETQLDMDWIHPWIGLDRVEW